MIWLYDTDAPHPRRRPATTCAGAPHIIDLAATLRSDRRCQVMPDGSPTQENLTAEQYRERAKLVRHAAQGVKSALFRHDLLDIAEEYDHLAETVDRWTPDQGG